MDSEIVNEINRRRVSNLRRPLIDAEATGYLKLFNTRVSIRSFTVFPASSNVGDVMWIADYANVFFNWSNQCLVTQLHCIMRTLTDVTLKDDSVGVDLLCHLVDVIAPI